jgi:hypothetical protein
MTNPTERLIADLKAYAEMVRTSWTRTKYPGFHAFVLFHGRPCIPQELPRGYRRRQMGQCFENAYRLARRRGLVYVEGFAARHESAFAPIHHAWCVEPGSALVIDPTWGYGDAYFGVSINLAYRKAQGGCVLDNWQAGWPILQEATDESEWRGEIIPASGA